MARPGFEPWRLRESFARRAPRHADARATFCIPHHNSPEFLEVALRAIRQHHADSRVVVADSTSRRESFVAAKELCRQYEAEWHPAFGKHGHSWLLHHAWRRVAGEVAVFMDQDCVLLASLAPLIRQIDNGVVLIGPGDGVTLNHPNYLAAHSAPLVFRTKPLFAHPSLMVTNAKKVRELAGDAPFRWRQELWGPEPQPPEGPYALSECVRRYDRNALVLLENRHTAYGCGTVYLYDNEPIAYHNWGSSVYGDPAARENPAYQWTLRETQRFLQDYWHGCVNLQLSESN